MRDEEFPVRLLLIPTTHTPGPGPGPGPGLLVLVLELVPVPAPASVPGLLSTDRLLYKMKGGTEKLWDNCFSI